MGIPRVTAAERQRRTPCLVRVPRELAREIVESLGASGDPRSARNAERLRMIMMNEAQADGLVGNDAEMRAELARLVTEGHDCHAIRRLAKKYATDRGNPLEVDSLTRKFRRWRKEMRTCPKISGAEE